MLHRHPRRGRWPGCLVVLLLACQLFAPARAADVPGLPGWQSLDIGTSLPGYVSIQPDGTWTIAASGADIGKLGDAFRYTFTPETGDFSITCRVTHQTNTDPSAKIGVMIRDTLDPGSRHFMLVRMPGNGVDPMWRVDMAQQTLDFKPKAYSGASRSGCAFSGPAACSWRLARATAPRGRGSGRWCRSTWARRCWPASA